MLVTLALADPVENFPFARSLFQCRSGKCRLFLRVETFVQPLPADALQGSDVLAELEKVSMRAKDAEAKLATAEQQEAELHRNIHNLEAELAMERRKVEEIMGRLHEVEKVATRVREMEGLLTAEQDRNGMLTRQVVEAEQASENATKRLEEMARKLSEIAGLASQLGNGRGEST